MPIEALSELDVIQDCGGIQGLGFRFEGFGFRV